MRRVMGRSVGLSCLLAVVAACGGAEFSSGESSTAEDGASVGVDAVGAGDDASLEDVTSQDAVAIRDADRDHALARDVTTGTDDGSSDDGSGTIGGDATTGGDTGAADSGSADATPDAASLDSGSSDAGDATAPDATPIDAGSGGSDAACTLTCGFLCCPPTYHCCNGGSSSPSCVPKNQLCPL